MRRKDREITNRDELVDILQRCDTVRVGMQGDHFPYVVPVSFGLAVEEENIVIYFHCAKQGMKVDLLEKNPNVCVEGDIFLGTNKTEHGVTTRYESVIGFGKCTFLKESEAVLKGLQVMVEHYGYPDYPLEDCMSLEHVLVGRIVLETVTGKRNLP